MDNSAWGQLEAAAAGLLDEVLLDELEDEPLVVDDEDELESDDFAVEDSFAAGFDSDDEDESDLSVETAGTAPDRESVR